MSGTVWGRQADPLYSVSHAQCAKGIVDWASFLECDQRLAPPSAVDLDVPVAAGNHLRGRHDGAALRAVHVVIAALVGSVDREGGAAFVRS